MNNAQWLAKIKEYVKGSTRLPAEHKIAFSGDERRLEITLRTAALAQSNMQDDDSAFEAWALVIMSACKVDSVTFNCETSEAGALTKSRHYQRALYRLQRFCELMAGRALLAQRDILLDSILRSCNQPTLNVATGRDTSEIISRTGSESTIEKDFKRDNSPARRRLMNAFGLIKLDRQFPIGLFDGEPKRGNEIFTAGKSAIDLIGTDRNKGLWLFELKNEANRSVGALSELFFYSAVLRDARQGLFKFSTNSPGARAEVLPEDVRQTKHIHARLLLGGVHPLITDGVFELLNEAADRAAWGVDFGRVDLGPYWQAKPS
jgi:hypothetical protein